MKKTSDGVQKLIYSILTVKALALLVFVAIYAGWLHLGDKTLLAQDEAAAKQPEGAEASEESAAKRSGGDVATAAKAGTGTGDGSFLERLLTLPSLDVEKSSKDEIGRYLTLVEQARQQVEDKSAVLLSRKEQLQKLEATISEKLKLLDEERQFFAKTIQQEKEIQAERLKTLVDLYAKMEPKKAAPMFESLDKDLVVALFKNMQEKQVTRILETMNPAKSVEITEYFGRVGSAREYDLLKEMNQSLQLAFNDCKLL